MSLRYAIGATCLAIVTVISTGCDNGYQDIEAGEPVSQQPEQSASPENSSPAGMNQRSGGRPSLGKAKTAAENTRGLLEAHDRDIQREIDRQNQDQ